jgi:hypothetical protein
MTFAEVLRTTTKLCTVVVQFGRVWQVRTGASTVFQHVFKSHDVLTSTAGRLFINLLDVFVLV